MTQTATETTVTEIEYDREGRVVRETKTLKVVSGEQWAKYPVYAPYAYMAQLVARNAK